MNRRFILILAAVAVVVASSAVVIWRTQFHQSPEDILAKIAPTQQVLVIYGDLNNDLSAPDSVDGERYVGYDIVASTEGAFTAFGYLYYSRGSELLVSFPDPVAVYRSSILALTDDQAELLVEGLVEGEYFAVSYVKYDLNGTRLEDDVWQFGRAVQGVNAIPEIAVYLGEG